MTDEELNAKIEELHLKLSQSQSTNTHPNQYPNLPKLTSKEHFDLWDDMWRLVKERESRREGDSV